MEGIIVVNKPKGITSFDVIRNLRKILKTKKIGHTGTLDPLATGVLVICVGKATKLAQDIEGYEKEYIADFELGYRTDSYDIEGKILERREFEPVSDASLEEILKEFTGKIKQVPPMFSAIKVDGKRLYDLARQGIEIERKSREVFIKEIEILEFDGRKGKIRCLVSKGTYIRSLIYDIGERLGTFATMTDLKRTRVGEEKIETSYTLEAIEKESQSENKDFLVSVEKYFRFQRVEITNDKDINLFKNGQRCKVKKENGKYRVYSSGVFLGLGEITNGLLKGYKYY